MCPSRRRAARRSRHPSAAAARLPPVHRGVADRADPRRRADRRRLPRHAARRGLVLGRGDRRLPDLLPSSDQHVARPAVRGPARARADALLRRRPHEGAVEAAASDSASVHLRGAEGVGHREHRRRDHRRAAVGDPGRPRRQDPRVQPVLRARPDPALGDEPDRSAARHLLLPRCGRRRTRRRAARPGELGMSVVKVEGISKEFRGGTVALRDVGLEIEAGEFVSLIGPSGCGKSTLLRILGDLIEPTRGTVALNGKTARQARRDRDYGIVFQDPVLYDWRTVAKNIGLPLELAGWSRQKRTDRVKEMLALVELSSFERHHPWQLSGGMQQRVSIARALSFDPALLLMDEPFGALDEMTRERLNMELLRIWERSGSTIVFVTHSIAEAVFLSTRVVVMSARPGRIAALVEIDLPQPRTAATREDPHFFELVTEVREALHLGHDMERAPA